MSDNFLGLDNSTLSKNSTDCLLNLLQLNLLGGPNTPSSVTVNSNVYNLPSGGGGGGGGGGGIGGNLGSISKSSTIPFYHTSGLPPPQQSQQQKQAITGRAITNTGNLCPPLQQQHHQHQQQQHQQQQSINSFGQPDIFSSASSDLNNEYKRLTSTENSMGSKPYRNGDGGYSDFGEFMSRDPYFNSMQSSTSIVGRPVVNNSATNQSFPPIGTFSLDSTTSSQSNQSIFPQPDFFNSTSNGGGGGGGGGGNSGGMNGIGPNSSLPYGNNSNNNSGDPSQATRETGIIEKLLHSYGFIQCCERQARLFFHFSQFSGNIEHLKIGDPVEFEMTYDRRTGKPIASQVTKIAPEVVLSEERVTGTVTTELKSGDGTAGGGGEITTTGRISYENRGECFFLPYNKDDVEGNVSLRSGDKVSFQIATNARGNLGACHIRLENPVHPVKYRGVVCSMKESFGFIERADVVKEIFFHFSEAEGSVELRPGDDVEFIIQTRNGKEVACNITRLAPGSVVFEDIGTTIYKGQVLKPLDRSNPPRQNNQSNDPHDPLTGRIRYRAADHSEVEVPFGDKDQKGDFTLRHGDWVQFLLATDRRDQLERATSISLLDETFEVSGERREQGVVANLKDGYGFLRCVDRTVRLFFHFTEVLDTARDLCVGDEVEFTTIQEPGLSFANNRLSAIRIKHLPPGKVQFETLMETNIEGTVTREAPKSPIKSQDRMEGGVITYTQANNKKTIMYFLKDCDKPPRVGDNVRFDICQVKRNKELIAVNIVDVQNNAIQSQQQQAQSPQGNGGMNNIDDHHHHSNHHNYQHDNNYDCNNDEQRNGSSTSCINSNSNKSPTSSSSTSNNGEKPSQIYHGFVAVLKENFGFIETLKHDEEVFFHFSNFLGNPINLELGNEVEYTLSKRSISNAGNCLPAENVKILQKGTISQPKILDTTYNGIVARPLRCINPDQQEYSGLLETIGDNGEAISTHELGITSLTNKRDLLQKDDYVVFKIDESGRAAEVTAVRQKNRATVDSIKGQFGFLNYEVEEGKKLFFHMSEVQGNANNLYPGDSVEFSVVTNQRTGKSSACNVVKLADNSASRPDRLLSRLKINSIDESVPRLIVIRQPKGPDGKGFNNLARLARLPGVLLD